MARYSQEYKQRVVARLLPPESSSVEAVSREIGVSVDTLERWRSQAVAMPEADRTWTAAARFEAVIATAAMDEAAKSAWCREHSVFPTELEKWRISAVEALASPQDARATPQQTRHSQRRIKELERER